MRTKTALFSLPIRENFMKRYRLCLSLSLTVALAQGTLLPANCAPIWQQISAGSSAPSSSPTKSKSVRQVAAPRAHSMLLLSGPSQNLSSVNSTKAALTIHGSLPITAESLPSKAEQAETASVAVPVAKSDEESGKALLAQLPPDSLIAQNEVAPVPVTPIPPVVSGTLDMEEFKSTNVIDLKVSQSRTFKTKNKIVRTSISDPAIAEPVVVAENQIVLLGKTPGTATMVLWDDAGNSVAIDLRVARDFSQLQSTLREIDPRIVVKTYNVGGIDRVILLGDVDHPESIIRAFAAANVFMDDRGLNIQVANNRLINSRVGELGSSGTGGGG